MLPSIKDMSTEKIVELVSNNLRYLLPVFLLCCTTSTPAPPLSLVLTFTRQKPNYRIENQLTMIGDKPILLYTMCPQMCTKYIVTGRLIIFAGDPICILDKAMPVNRTEHKHYKVRINSQSRCVLQFHLPSTQHLLNYIVFPELFNVPPILGKFHDNFIF